MQQRILPNMNPSPHMIEEAIRWMVILQSGKASVEDYEACLRWREASPQHQVAWERLSSVNQQVQKIPPGIAHTTLNSGEHTWQRINRMWQRRQALKLILVAGGSAGLFSLGYQKLPWRPMLADYATKVGERQLIALADSTEVQLNTSSAIDVAYSEQLRMLRLYQGEMLVTTGHEHGTTYRPFIVDTAHGRLRALGTRFLVRTQDQGIRVSVFDGAVEVSAAGRQQIVPTGQSLFFTQNKMESLQLADQDSLSWINGVIVARNMRLDMFLQELNRYHHGHIQCDQALESTRISGVFPHNDINKVLDAVSDTLHVRIKRSWHYWIKVMPAG